MMNYEIINKYFFLKEKFIIVSFKKGMWYKVFIYMDVV